MEGKQANRQRAYGSSSQGTDPKTSRVPEAIDGQPEPRWHNHAELDFTQAEIGRLRKKMKAEIEQLGEIQRKEQQEEQEARAALDAVAAAESEEAAQKAAQQAAQQAEEVSSSE